MARPDVKPPTEKSSAEATARDVAERAKQESEQLAGEARHEASRLAAEARERGSRVLQEQKQSAATQIGNIAHALHETGYRLDEQNQPQIARYAHWAGDGLDYLSNTLRESDVGTLVDRVTDYARRQPAVFIGGAVAAGFLLSRFLKSTQHEEGAGVGEAYEAHGTTAYTTTETGPATTGAPDVERGEVR